MEKITKEVIEGAISQHESMKDMYQYLIEEAHKEIKSYPARVEELIKDKAQIIAENNILIAKANQKILSLQRDLRRFK